MTHNATTETALQGRYAHLAGAPRGLRRVQRAGQIERLVERGRELARAELEMRLARESLALELRASGASWESVGWVLGTTGSAARQRYGQ